MTPDRIEALQAQFNTMNRRVNEWCILQGNSRTKKGAETVMAMLQARQVADELLKALWQEATEGLMLRDAYLTALHAAHTGDFPAVH